MPTAKRTSMVNVRATAGDLDNIEYILQSFQTANRSDAARLSWDMMAKAVERARWWVDIGGGPTPSEAALGDSVEDLMAAECLARLEREALR